MPLQGVRMDHTLPRVSLRLPWAKYRLGFQSDFSMYDYLPQTHHSTAQGIIYAHRHTPLLTAHTIIRELTTHNWPAGLNRYNLCDYQPHTGFAPVCAYA